SDAYAVAPELQVLERRPSQERDKVLGKHVIDEHKVPQTPGNHLPPHTQRYPSQIHIRRQLSYVDGCLAAQRVVYEVDAAECSDASIGGRKIQLELEPLLCSHHRA